MKKIRFDMFNGKKSISRKLKFMQKALLVTSALAFICPTAFAAQTITIDDVTAQAVSASSTIFDQIIEIEKQQYILDYAISNVLLAEKNGDFYNLFNDINTEDFTGELNLVSTVAAAQDTLISLIFQKQSQILSAQNGAIDSYYTVLAAQYEVETLTNQYATMNDLCIEYETKYKIGACDLADYSYAVVALEELKKDLQTAYVNYDLAVQDLGNAYGADLTLGYEFLEYFPTFDLSRDSLEDVYVYAMENEYTLAQTIESTEAAQEEIDDILDFFVSKYSSNMNSIKEFLSANDYTDFNADNFELLYNQAMTYVDDLWTSDYYLNVGAFEVAISKRYYNQNYSDSMDLLNEKKYDLYEALKNLEQAEASEESVISDMKSDIEKAYTQLNLAITDMSTAETTLATATSDYETAVNENKMGNVTFLDLELKRDAVITAEDDVYEKKIAYARLINEFNLITGGYVDYVNGIIYNDSLGYMLSDEANEWWLILDEVNDMFRFNCNISAGYALEEYQLVYNGIALGEKISTDEIWEQSAIAYDGTTNIDVFFYRNGVVKYKTSIDLLEFTGKMSLEETSEVPTQIGSDVGWWYLESADILRAKLAIDVENIEYTHFEVLIDGKSYGKVARDEYFVILSLYLSDKSRVTVNLYNNSSLVNVLTLGNGNDSGLLFD